MMARRSTTGGFTLVELMMVMTLIAIIGAYAVVQNASASAYTLKSQADTLAANIRHVQAAATNWGRSLRITLTAGTNGSYSVTCVTTGTSPCNVSPVLNPATGSGYTNALAKGVAISGTSTLDFDNFGKPAAAASYTLSAGGNTFTVAVAALTGNVTVTTP
jgi:prepilin-type N-terminal cleavage/methylation domain-containing protein